MAAPKGNTYYLLAKNFGKPKKYKTGAALWKKALEYVEFVGKNPLKEEKAFANGRRMTISKMRAMTLAEFCLFAKIHRDTFNQYEKEKEYSDVCARIKEIFYIQKFQGASADLLNHAIIARDLGLVDRKDITTDDESLNQGYYDYLKTRRKPGPPAEPKGD